ncbi:MULTISPECIES: hypothetical protein [Sorangium]|uniref:Uncharacterized protein n=1 Tax=Sorangium cellulosum TaxID=56 RepID=A0A4P2QNE5_SORCE|nr:MULTISPECIES: hypothetical protein [Sorangium]AUX31398.1 uncharacterized protein SOCE836_035270 [Sorangium cellulosum]WCQ90781.1 hypothetical protein NQZ70_03493 [Sorangium sp. Soce836]
MEGIFLAGARASGRGGASAARTIGPVLALSCHALFTAWFVAVGSVLYKMR